MRFKLRMGASPSPSSALMRKPRLGAAWEAQAATRFCHLIRPALLLGDPRRLPGPRIQTASMRGLLLQVSVALRKEMRVQYKRNREQAG